MGLTSAIADRLLAIAVRALAIAVRVPDRVLAIADRVLAIAVRAVYPRLEPELARLPEFVPRGGTAVDVGGWFGPWTQRLRRRADRVVTIEADPRMAALLTKAFPDVPVIQAACTATNQGEDLRLWIPDNRLSGLASVEHRTGRSISVPRITLDSLRLTGVTFVKLDIEGHELHALRGARETIQRDRPTLLLELEERHHPVQPVIDLLADWGYEGHILDHGTWTPLAAFPLKERQQATRHRLAQSMLTRLLRPEPRYPNSVLFRPQR